MISAEIIADSVSELGIRITTFELEYPRFIHAELLTHRVFSRNAASSRAIPVERLIEHVEQHPAKPVHWGLNKPGMQAEGVHGCPTVCNLTWEKAKDRAVRSAYELKNLGLHKQIVNRVLEPFQTMKTVLTATELENFFSLRAHEDAQPEIQALAFAMQDALAKSKPKLLSEGEWHLPYADNIPGYAYTTEDKLMISSSCCAQVSYRSLDDSLEKASLIYDKLIESEPMHASPFEHQATPMSEDVFCANFRGWIQHRTFLENLDELEEEE